jgi:hypothetical protein
MRDGTDPEDRRVDFFLPDFPPDLLRDEPRPDAFPRFRTPQPLFLVLFLFVATTRQSKRMPAWASRRFDQGTTPDGSPSPRQANPRLHERYPASERRSIHL